MTRYEIALIIIPVVALIAFFAWRAHRQRQAERSSIGGGQTDDAPLHSLVWLLRRPRPMGIPDLVVAAERAFAIPFNRPGPGATIVSAGKQDQFIINMAEMALGLINAPSTYVDDPGKAADEIKDFSLKRAMQEHNAWIAVDLLGQAEGELLNEGYRRIGKLLAELAGPDCLALLCPETEEMNSYAADLLPPLRGPDPLQAFSVKRPDKVTYVEEQDVRLADAVKEAKNRFGEFADAFQRRRPQQSFAVKVPFHDGIPTECEYMWVEVASLQSDSIQGKLVNEPAYVKSVKLHDPVTIKVADVQDWIYSDGRRMVGGFSAKVLAEAEKEG